MIESRLYLYPIKCIYAKIISSVNFSKAEITYQFTEVIMLHEDEIKLQNIQKKICL